MHTKDPSLQPLISTSDRVQTPRPLLTSDLQNDPSAVATAAGHPLNGLPPELDDYLTTTSKPHEIFSALHDSRDRRFRLLLRRFTNQIQYGCRNPYCDVTTCLSYRKRHAKTPIRPYTDVAARALAWRCIEQYADTRKQNTQNDHVTAKRNGKNEASLYRGVPGLCRNEPVVPWFEDPSEARRRVKKTTQGQNLEHNISDYTQATPNSRSMISQSNSEANQAGLNSDPAIIGSYNAQGTSDSERLTISDSHDVRSACTAQIDGCDKHTGRSTALDHNSTAERRHVHFVDPFEDDIQQRERAPKDIASFTQVLYDTVTIKQFDIIHPPQKPFKDVSHTLSDSDFDFKSTNYGMSKGAIADSSSTKAGGTVPLPFTSTFKLLPLSAILWLRSIMPYDAQSSPPRDLGTTVDYGAYSIFARQSVHFCLSRPKILLESAKTWHFEHQQPYTLDEEERTRTIKRLVLSEKKSLPSSDTFELPQPGGIVVAFGMLIAMTSIPELLNHLFAALQHAYVLPPWLGHIRKMEDLSSKGRSAARAESSGRYRENPHGETSQPRSNPAQSKSNENSYIEDDQVAQLCILVAFALYLVLVLKRQPFNTPNTSPSKHFNEHYSLGRNSGSAFPYASLIKAWSKDVSARSNYQTYAFRTDTMDDWRFQRVLDSLMDVLGHRLAIEGIKKSSKMHGLENEQATSVIDLFIREIAKACEKPDPVVHKMSFLKNLMDLLRSVILRRWDREAVIQRCSVVGGALEVLAALYRQRDSFGIPASEFQWTFVSQAFDEFEMPVRWLDFRADNIQTHMLSYSFLFGPESLVRYFRAINSSTMVKSYQSASDVRTDAEKFMRNDHKMPINVYGVEEVLNEMRPNMAPYFVLTIRRSDMLRDAINQIWRRQRQELMRPLKVRLGQDEGEDGLDHGGVQAEFFRMLFAEALGPGYGMFTVDDRTRMIWFRPGSVEPLYKFEALGILMSLAVYNGITLPLTFPLAFYRKLLDLKVKTIQHVSDGWPDLTRGLRQLLDWTDGDVGDVIARTYEFSYEAFGVSYTIDISKVGRDDPWPPVERRKSKEKLKTTFEFPPKFSPAPPSDDEDSVPEQLESSSYLVPASPTKLNDTSTPLSLSNSSLPSPEMKASASDTEAPLVTNANRDQYVKDYIYWLTDKSIAPQFATFASGFYTCLDKTALSIFTPEHLKSVIEGHQTIDIDKLQATTTYDDYKPTDQVVQWFWQVVRDMSPKQHKKLLEFVTASDRVPVNGLDSVVFIVQRNGPGDEKLPQSSTCYGRLLLPNYSTKEILRTKLEKAIEHSIGFGSL